MKKLVTGDNAYVGLLAGWMSVLTVITIIIL